MNAYLISLVIHVVTAVLGLGNVAAVTAIAAAAPGAASIPLMRRLIAISNAALGLMLVSGIAILWSSNWMFLHAWWFRISVVLFLLIGMLNGQVALRLKRDPEPHRMVFRLGVAKCLLIAATVALMESKAL